jgi:GT2 family glycosyltransferase
MYKREVFEKLRMDETLNTAEEYEFNLRCLKNGFKIGYCATSLAFYRRHPKQKVRVVSIEEKDREREMVKAMYND